MPEAPRQWNRRDLFKASIATAAGLMIGASKFERLGLAHGPEEKESLRQSNVELLPEYKKTLERVTFSISVENGQIAPNGDIYDLIEYGFPDYTTIQMIVESKNLEQVKEWALSRFPDRDFIFLEVSNPEVKVDSWPQDFGEQVWEDGQEKFLVPMNPEDETLLSKIDGERLKSRKLIVQELLDDSNVLIADFHFDGGNLLFDETGDQTRIFIGFDEIKETIENYQAMGKRLSKEQVSDMISSQFGGAEVIIIGDTEQSIFAFHIDQSFILLDNQTAVVNQFTGKAESDDPVGAEQARLYAEQLRRAGYKVFTIEQKTTGIYPSTNALPYIDRDTGEKKVIFPVFGHELEDLNIDGIQPKENLKGKGLMAYEAYENAGYIPTPIKDYLSQRYKGSFHCSALVIA